MTGQRYIAQYTQRASPCPDNECARVLYSPAAQRALCLGSAGFICAFRVLGEDWLYRVVAVVGCAAGLEKKSLTNVYMYIYA